nr:Dam family site-specific DNA-(adenine-N6)-methyltransferase [uncultured Sphaerochaeta sp.]
MQRKKFIRWAGGKQNMLKELLNNLPIDIEHRTLIEPFVGAATLFLNTNTREAALIDLNPFLMNTYSRIKDTYEEVYSAMKDLESKHNKEYYYKVRNDFNNDKSESIQQAARFIYLIQSSYNGIFRVNQQGIYNVPFGKNNPHFPSKEEFRYLSEKLQGTKLRCEDFSCVEEYATESSFIYFDPPYMPLNATSYFQHYTKERFQESEQVRLSKIANTLSTIGSKVMISSPNHDMIRNLYSDWRIIEIGVKRTISCKKNRATVSEILIMNY